MSYVIQTRGNSHQLRVSHELLPKKFIRTYPDLAEAERVRDHMRGLLDSGVVPAYALPEKEAHHEDMTPIPQVIAGYERAATPAESDLPMMMLLRGKLAKVTVSGLGYAFAEAWVKDMKMKENLAPGTIRKYVGCMARVLDWHLKRTTPKGREIPRNPLRLLPRGYSQYTSAERAALAKAERTAKVDESRDRRLLPAEEAAVRRVLAGEKREDRERPLPADPDLGDAFDLIVDSGIRLSEMFKLRAEAVDLERGVLRLDGSKAARGQRKPRTVPLKKPLRVMLARRLEGRKPRDLVFGFWDGKEDPKKCSARLSGRFRTLFQYAGITDMTEHDLRHEATCRWFLLRRPDGAWTFSDIEICRIMGWTSTRMALRYASLRGEDLADRLL